MRQMAPIFFALLFGGGTLGVMVSLATSIKRGRPEPAAPQEEIRALASRPAPQPELESEPAMPLLASLPLEEAVEAAAPARPQSRPRGQDAGGKAAIRRQARLAARAAAG